MSGHNWNQPQIEDDLDFGLAAPTAAPTDEDNNSFAVTSNGLSTGVILAYYKFDKESNTWVQIPLGGTVCPAPMTRAALLSLRNGSNLDTNCHYIITDPAADGNLDAQQIILHAVANNQLGMQVGIITSHDNTAWAGVYDIDANNVLEVTDNLENNVKTNASINAFPFGVAGITNNTVESDAIVIHTAGTVNANIFRNSSSTTINGGSFNNNVVDTNANVVSSGNTQRNTFEAQSNTTINSGDFRENKVLNDATVTSSTTGDVDNNNFSNSCLVNISGAANLDGTNVSSDANLTMTGGTMTNCDLKQTSNTTINGGSLVDSEVGQDADVVIQSGSNYENVFGASTSYRQVGTGYIRYCSIEGTTSVVNGNTNFSNVTAYTSTINTTGSAGTISNSNLNRAYMVNLQNIPSLTITDCTISNYATIQTNGSARIYLYRTTVTDGGRILCSAGARIDASYTNVNSYGYIQCTQSGGVLFCNYTNIGGLSYVRNLTANTHRVDRCLVVGQSSIRFDGNSDNCRVYYSESKSGGAIYMTTGAVGCYVYYSNSNSNGQIYCQNTTNARIYYCNADSRGYIRVYNNTGQAIMYYCKASASGYVEQTGNSALIRMYAVSAAGQAICRVQNSTTNSNLYYSTFEAYYYLLVTLTGGTRSALHGYGRRSYTVTNPPNGTYTQNF